MSYKSYISSIDKTKLKTLNKSSSVLYEEILEEDLKEVFDGWSTEELTNDLLILFRLIFQSGYVCGKINRKQKNNETNNYNP